MYKVYHEAIPEYLTEFFWLISEVQNYNLRDSRGSQVRHAVAQTLNKLIKKNLSSGKCMEWFRIMAET